MILIIEILIIVILIMIMMSIVIDEANRRKRIKHLHLLKGYWDGRERRAVARHKVVLDVNYIVNHGSKPTKTKDISTCGIGLVLEEKMKRKTLLSMEIKLDNEKDPIKVRGRVMWSKEAADEEKQDQKRLFNTGIKFIRFNDRTDEKRLFDYIRTIEKNASQDYPYAKKT